MYEPKLPTVAVRPTRKQLDTLEAWCASHPDNEGNTPPLAEALRAAIEALAIMEKRRQQSRDRKQRAREIEERLRAYLAQISAPALETCPACQREAPAVDIQRWAMCETCMLDLPL